MVDPSFRIRCFFNDRSCETSLMVRTGLSKMILLLRKSSSIIASNIDVEPTFKNVAISLIFASPQITCRRRYFVASACGSSLVFMMGRLRVVSKPTSSSKKSAR